MGSKTYHNFLNEKTHLGGSCGFRPIWMLPELFDFQKSLVEWACLKGRAAIFADCGLGKTPIQLTWAENVIRKSNGRVLILTPLSVTHQTIKEGEKFGIEVVARKDKIKNNDKIIVTNYERLKHFSPNDYNGVVCDESSILKNFDGQTRKLVTEFMRKIPYRLLCTATAAPNDYIELGTSSEALGVMGCQDMLNKFFKRSKNFVRMYNAGGQKWEMRSHAERDFWRWVCSWARAIRRPSDFGYNDKNYKLPPLIINQHVVKASQPRDGHLFDLPAVGLAEQRSDLRRTINERCEMASKLINERKEQSIAWCNLNDEGKLLEKLIDGAVEVSGSDTDDYKEDVFNNFVSGKVRVLVTKPTIGGFGLNFQNCNHQSFFPSHSYEQYYQCVRRSWRYGQENPVTVDMITTDGQENVLKNLKRKSKSAELMFDNLVSMMQNELNIKKKNDYTIKEVIPSWLSNIKK